MRRHEYTDIRKKQVLRYEEGGALFQGTAHKIPAHRPAALRHEQKEFESVRVAVGLDALIDPKAPDLDLIKYMANDAARIERLLEYPDNIRTPVVRNGKQATVGYCPEIWKTWE